MATRTVVRDFTLRFVRVATVHPQFGRLDRSRIYPQRTVGWRSAWEVIDCDHAQVGEGPVVGDYLDAERVLLEATAGLDEIVPADELADED
jgi:hypothetical protein